MPTDNNPKLSRLARLMRLDVYKSSLMTHKTASTLSFGAGVLMFQFIMNVIIWSMTFQVAFQDSYWFTFPLMLSTIVSFVIFSIDRGLLLATVGKFKKAMWLRVGFIALAAIITAQAFALATFTPDINERINQREEEARAAIVIEGERVERLAYDGEDKNDDGKIEGDDEVGLLEKEAIKYNGFDKNGDGKIEGDDEIGLIGEKQVLYNGDGTDANKGLIENERLKHDGEDTDGDGDIDKPGLVAQAEGKVTGDASSAKTAAETAYAQYLATRATQRTTMLKPYDDQVAELTAERQQITEAKSKEAGGAGISGRRGRGAAFKSLRESEQAIAGQLARATAARAAFLKSTVNPFDAETQREAAKLQASILSAPAAAKATAEAGLDSARGARDRSLRDLREKRDLEVKQLRTKRDAAIKDLREERNQKVLEVKQMEGPALVKLYGGDWEQPRGVMARSEVLHELIFESHAKMAWYIIFHLVVLFVDFGVLLYKGQAADGIGQYLNEEMQLAANDQDPGLTQIAAIRGLNSDAAIRMRSMYGPETIALLAALYAAREKASGAYRNWLKQPNKLCNPKDGLCMRKHHIRLQLEELWGDTVQPTILEVSKAIEDLQAKGAVVPEWPQMFGTDPATLEEPWNDYTDEELDRRGWTDPEPLFVEIKGVKDLIVETRDKIDKIVVNNIQAPLIEVIADTPKISMTELRRFYAADFAWFGQELTVQLNHLDGQEQWLRDKNQDVPAWDHGFIGDREGIRQLWKLPADLLRNYYGWQGENDMGSGFVPGGVLRTPVVPGDRPVTVDDDSETPTVPEIDASAVNAAVDEIEADAGLEPDDDLNSAWWTNEDATIAETLADANRDGQVDPADDWARSDRPVLSPREPEPTKPYPLPRRPDPTNPS